MRLRNGKSDTDRVITRNSQGQPVFFQPINKPGFVALRWQGKEWLLSVALAEELLADLKNAAELARR